MLEKRNEVKSAMEKFKALFIFTGFLLAIVSGIAYLILLYIIITGFKVEIGRESLLLFLGLGAVDGVLISLAMRIQGIDFAKAESDSKEVLKDYKDLISKEEKVYLMPMWLFMLINTIKDVIFKGGTVMFTLYFSITIMIEGIGDMKYFWLGVLNVLMYLGFGFLSLAKSYDHYLEVEIPLIKQKINKIEKEKEKENVEIFREIIEDDSDTF